MTGEGLSECRRDDFYIIDSAKARRSRIEREGDDFARKEGKAAI